MHVQASTLLDNFSAIDKNRSKAQTGVQSDGASEDASLETKGQSIGDISAGMSARAALLRARAAKLLEQLNSATQAASA